MSEQWLIVDAYGDDHIVIRGDEEDVPHMRRRFEINHNCKVAMMRLATDKELGNVECN